MLIRSSWLPLVAVAISVAIVSACGTASVSSAPSQETEEAPAAATPASCSTMLTGTVENDDAEFLEVMGEATLSGAQLVDWLNTRGEMHAVDEASKFSGLTDKEVVEVCMFKVAGFSPPGPVSGDVPNGATFVLRVDHDPVLDAIGNLDRMQPMWDKLPK
jgi:hypothetical protein